MRHGRHLGFNLVNLSFSNYHRRDIRIGHIAVIIGISFDALRKSLLFGVIPATGLLDDRTALFQDLYLAVDLVINGFFPPIGKSSREPAPERVRR